MSCCKSGDEKKLDDYFENESNGCGRKKEGKCWWSPLFIIDYIVVVLLMATVPIFKLKFEPYRMYVPTVNITTAVLDSEGVPHNVVQTIDITQDRQYPAIPEALPTLYAGFVFVLIGVASWIIGQVVLLPAAIRKWNIIHDAHNTALGVAESISLELFIVELIKPFAGRYRPRYNEIAASAGSDITKEWEARVSYPSGHSASAFAVSFFFTLYLLGKTRAYSSNSRYGGGSAGRFAAVFFSMIPTIAAFMIAVTRTRDYMHNFSDINAGAIIGILSSILAYFTVYPSLTDPHCQLPRIRLPGKIVKGDDNDSKSKEGEDDSLEVVVVNTDSDVVTSKQE